MKLSKQVEAIIDDSLPLVSNLANISSLIYYGIKNTSWAGFYLSDEKEENLYLNCFQGSVACTKIPFSKGVCGTSAFKKESVVVPDVLKFPGHIACSSKSRSEIVVPLLKNDHVLGVIDLDSELYDNFHEEEQKELEEIAKIVVSLFK